MIFHKRVPGVISSVGKHLKLTMASFSCSSACNVTQRSQSDQKSSLKFFAKKFKKSYYVEIGRGFKKGIPV